MRREIEKPHKTIADAPKLGPDRSREEIVGRYTVRAARRICFARHFASYFGSPVVECVHILLSVVREGRDHCKLFFPFADSKDTAYKKLEEHFTPGGTIELSGKIVVTEGNCLARRSGLNPGFWAERNKADSGEAWMQAATAGGRFVSELTRILCVCAPRAVRFPPHTLRTTTIGRMAYSARQLVAAGRVRLGETSGFRQYKSVIDARMAAFHRARETSISLHFCAEDQDAKWVKRMPDLSLSQRLTGFVCSSR
jgi:hypothetical protein